MYTCMSREKPCEKSTNSRDLRARMFANQKHGNDMSMLVAQAIPRDKCELLTQPKNYLFNKNMRIFRYFVR